MCTHVTFMLYLHSLHIQYVHMLNQNISTSKPYVYTGKSELPQFFTLQG